MWDVAPAWRGALKLATQLVHDDVDRAAPGSHRAAPQAFVQQLTFDRLVAGAGQKLEHFELAPRQVETASGHERLVLVTTDLHLADRDVLAIRRLGPAPVAHSRLDARD